TGLSIIAIFFSSLQSVFYRLRFLAIYFNEVVGSSSSAVFPDPEAQNTDRYSGDLSLNNKNFTTS
ncbi:MAG: hypothetical protein J5499_02640, partial [Lachnospiraceae bacterium]|nr:hypothetical protein [Lachnospiraceae bacterium]